MADTSADDRPTMTQANEGLKSMDAAIDSATLIGWASHLLELVGLGGVGLAWRAGSRVTSIEAAVATQRELVGRLESRVDAGEAQTTFVREKLASMPTREQIAADFHELREDVRADIRGVRDDIRGLKARD